MKKILLGTTAIVSVIAFAAPSFAGEKIKLGLSGFARQYIANIDHAEATDVSVDLAMWANNEIYFRGSTESDNGLKFAVRVELEANGADNGHIDESSMTISSDQFGAVSLGAHAHRIDAFAVRAPRVSKMDFGDVGGWAQGYAATAGEIADFGDKTIKVGYVSPQLSGFTIYASYGMGEGFGGTDAGREVARSLTQDSASFGVAYSGDFQGTGFDADLGHYIDNANDVESIRGAISLTMDGLGFGGGYTAFKDNSIADVNEGDAYELGVSYAAGAYEVSATYMAASSTGTAAAGDHSDETVILAANYDLGSGIVLSATYFNAKADKVYQLAKKYFGPLKGPAAAKVKPQREVKQRGERRIKVKAPAEVPYLLMGYKPCSMAAAARVLPVNWCVVVRSLYQQVQVIASMTVSIACSCLMAHRPPVTVSKNLKPLFVNRSNVYRITP